MRYRYAAVPARACPRVGCFGLALVLAFAPCAVAYAGGGPEPDTSFLQVEPDPTNDPTGDFRFASTIPESTFECSVDGAEFVACPTPFSTAPLTDGPHVLDVRAREPGGTVDPTPASHAWTVDTIRPDTTITSGPSGGVTVDTATFEFTSTEPGTFLCQRDGGPTFGCTSPITFEDLAQGSHTFVVRAVDLANNSDLTPATRSWTVDSQGPDTTILSGPSGATPVATATFTFSSNEGIVTFECALDEEEFAACATPKVYTDLVDGPHVFAVRAIDIAGNPDESPASRSWTVDTQIPDTQVDDGPGAFSNSTTAVLVFSSNEPGATFECAIDGAALAPCASPRTYEGLAAGQHLFGVRARDAAGNVDATPAVRAWIVDLTAPDTTIQSGPPVATTEIEATFAFTATEPGSTFACALDSEVFDPCTSPKSYTSLADGSHVFSVRATDPAGNTDPTPAARGWTVDTTPPITTFLSTPTDPSALAIATFSFRADEESTFRCSLDVAPFSACTSPFTTPTLANGAHSFEVEATDALGNVEATPATYTWTIVADEVFSNDFEGD